MSSWQNPRNASEQKPCSSSLGTFGEYAVRVGETIIPNSATFVNAAYRSAVISKNAAGDVYVVGYLTGTTESCVQPYPVAKAQMTKGTGWTFVDVAGVARTAVVVSDHVTASFTTPSVAGPGTTTTYTGVVAQVSYGSDQTIYWAAGYGPVQTLNTFTNSGQYAAQVTASNWTLDPSSK